MNRSFVIFIAIFIAAAFISSVSGQEKKIPVFVSGNEGHKSYRIPALVTLPNGDLLAFCEGRVNGSGDFGDINIVMKKSTDHGNTWSHLQTIVDNTLLQAGNPAPVVDVTDLAWPKGRVFLFYNTGNNSEGEVRKGNGLREVWYKTSTDGGLTWSQPVNITTQVHRPNQPALNAAYQFSEDWRAYANTPGHGAQFLTGRYKGRIYIAANHSYGNPQPRYRDGRAHGYYSDDHGKTFHLSEAVPAEGGNEATAAPISNGGLMMNVRNQVGSPRARIVAISRNGGERWDTTYFDQQLPDPVCEGSILQLGMKKGKAVLAFCNAADTVRRDNLTLRISDDDGQTWKKSFLIDKSPDGKGSSFTAYSDLSPVNKKQVGVLYERNNYAEIIFTTVKWQ
jgi:sialidase-1